MLSLTWAIGTKPEKASFPRIGIPYCEANILKSLLRYCCLRSWAEAWCARCLEESLDLNMFEFTDFKLWICETMPSGCDGECSRLPLSSFWNLTLLFCRVEAYSLLFIFRDPAVSNALLLLGLWLLKKMAVSYVPWGKFDVFMFALIDWNFIWPWPV